MTEHTELTSAMTPNGAPHASTPLDSPIEERLRVAELKLRVIQEISQLLTAKMSFKDVLGAIVERTKTLMGCERATLYRLVPEQNLLVADLSTNQDSTRIEVPVGQGIAGAVITDGREINLKDAYRDRRFDPATDKRLGIHTTSILCVPIKDQAGAFLGVLEASNKIDGYFTPDDAGLLNAVASQSGIVLRNSELFVQAFERNLQLAEANGHVEARKVEVELLLEIEHAAAVARNLDEALPGILKPVVARYPTDLAAVFLLNPARTGVELVASAGTIDLDVTRQRLTLARSLPWIDALLSDVPRPDDEALRDAIIASPLGAHFADTETIANAWDFPIRRGADPVLGVLVIINCPSPDDRAPHHGMHQAHRILSSVAERIALAATLAHALDEERKAERLASIGTALSGVVHDLRTPLTIIAGYARSMEREADRDKRVGHRDIIKRQIASIQEMIGEVLDFASGRSEVLLRRVFVRELIGDIEILLGPDLAEHGVNLAIEMIYKGAVKADPKKLMRVFANIIKNAREALGGPRPDDAAPPTITLTVESEGDMVCFCIRDNGPGFPAELEGRLFESFATHGKGHGTGLGLAMARKIIAEHEGTLTATSPTDGGALITISLPAA